MCVCGVGVKLWLGLICFFVKQKTAYEMRMSDWISDVCSSDLSLSSFSFVVMSHKRQPSGLISSARMMRLKSPSYRRPNSSLKSTRRMPTAANMPDMKSLMRFAMSWSSEERRVGKEGGRKDRSRWAQDH